MTMEALSDEQILALCELMMTDADQAELSDLLGDNREGLLDEHGEARLEAFMDVYRRSLLLKSEALRVAVQRGLRPPLG